MNPKMLVLVALASSCFMTGLIWFVQVVHYPLFERVDQASFSTYHAEHSRLTTFVVFVPMVLELLTSLLLLVERPAHVSAWLLWAGAILAGLSWLSTGLIQVPLHGRLASGFNLSTQALLVTTNWLRCITWTGHCSVCLGIVWQMLRS